MKNHIAVIAVASLSSISATTSWAQSGGMGSMDMMMKDGKNKASEKNVTEKTHIATGTVTAMDKAGGKVTIAHGPVQTMKWPPMTMTFGVKDKALLEKFSPGKKVDFEFMQMGSDYIVTSAK